jgi:AraC family transcriptional regulator
MIEELMEAHLENQISGTDLARSLNMSNSRFSEALKNTKGLAPYQYILKHRLTRAYDLVAHSELCLAEIAYKTGFSSQSHMTRLFKSKLGITPGSIRSSPR